MKKLSILVVMSGMLALGTSVVFAGEGCDMKKGHTKELTAEALKKHGNGHWWLFSEEKDAGNDALISKEKPAGEVETTTNDRLIEI